MTALPADSPSGPAGSVKVVEFTLQNRPFLAINAGPLDPFNHAVSFVITCADQAEIDRLWAALSDGGQVQMPMTKTFFSERFGMLADKFGVGWMILVAK